MKATSNGRMTSYYNKHKFVQKVAKVAIYRNIGLNNRKYQNLSESIKIYQNITKYIRIYHNV